MEVDRRKNDSLNILFKSIEMINNNTQNLMKELTETKINVEKIWLQINDELKSQFEAMIKASLESKENDNILHKKIIAIEHKIQDFLNTCCAVKQKVILQSLLLKIEKKERFFSDIKEKYKTQIIAVIGGVSMSIITIIIIKIKEIIKIILELIK